MAHDGEGSVADGKRDSLLGTGNHLWRSGLDARWTWGMAPRVRRLIMRVLRGASLSCDANRLRWPKKGGSAMSGLFRTPRSSMDFWQFTPQALLPLMAALAAASAAVQVWRRRESPQAGWLATVLFGAAWWAGIAVLEYATTALWGKIFFSQLTYLGIALAP